MLSMLKEFDGSKDTDNITNWETRNKKYIQQIIMQKKQAQLQSQQAAEEEQKRKLKLSRRVLGASFQRLFPQQAAALSRSPEPGGGNNSAPDSDAGYGAGPCPGAPEHGTEPSRLERNDIRSQVPRLPPLTDVSDTAAAAAASTATDVSSVVAAPATQLAVEQQRHGASILNQAAADGVGAGAGADADASDGAGGGAASPVAPPCTRRSMQMRVGGGGGGGGVLRAQNPLCRSVSAQRADAPPHTSPYYSDSCGLGSGGASGGGGGGGSHTRPVLRQQRQQRIHCRQSPPPLTQPQQPQQRQSTQKNSNQHQQQQHLRSHRARRSTFPEPSTRSVQSATATTANDPNEQPNDPEDGDDEGPDVAVNDRRTVRRREAKTTTLLRSHHQHQHQHQQPQAPVLAVAARSSFRLVAPAAAAAAGLAPSPVGFALWRARSRLPDGQKVFCIAGSGNHSQGIRAGLLARGWYENPDHNSPFFDFKWAANPLDINHYALWPGQIVNHFRHSTCLTTKHGLCYTVRETVWYAAADAAAFYPRAYDITDESSRREFLQDVRFTAAEALIKRALIDGAVCTTYVPYSPKRKSSNHSAHQQHGKASFAAAAAAGTIVDGGGGGNGEATAPPGDDACAGMAGGGGGDGSSTDEGLHRLHQRLDSGPLVDLPSLRLACRVVAARLRQHRHLRVVHESSRQGPRGGGCGGGGGGGGSRTADPDEPAPEVEPSAAAWQQLLKHRALSCSAPVLPPPQFDPSWIQNRSFITSALLPPAAVAPGKAKRSGGGSPRRKSKAGRNGGMGVQGRRCRSGDGGDGGGTGTGGDTDGGGGSSDGGEVGGDLDGDSGCGGFPPAASAPSAGRTAEDDAVEDEKGEAAAAAAAAAAARRRPRDAVVVADAAELLREVYGKSRRRHSAPPSHRQEGGNAGDVLAAAAAASEPLSSPPLPQPQVAAAADAAAAAEGEQEEEDIAGWGADSSGGGDVDADASDGGPGNTPGPSWLPEDLPAICYDDVALQALDLSTWRPAAEALLGALESSAVQTHISGTNNIWIVKPAGKSRGRGIRLFNDPDALLSYVRGEEAQGLESRWIAQKYVERPLVISRRKFDIRQWVLVTDWNPLQAWFYSTCYLRFAADDYDPSTLDIFQHLTNNSVSKYFEGPVKADEITAAGNMWSIPRFQQWLAEVYGRDDIWDVLLQPAMRHIAICTLKSGQDHIAPRKGSCQLYGYDFLIDDQLRVWLLEVNSSPTLEPSTAITAQLCADVQEDILKVVVDLPDQLAAAAARGRARGGSGGGGGGGEQSAPSAGGPEQPRQAIGGAAVRATSGPAAAAARPGGGFDTGKWECIIDGGEELRPPQYTGLNLELKGTAIQLNPPRSNFAGRLYAATRQQQQQQQTQHGHSVHQQQQLTSLKLSSSAAATAAAAAADGGAGGLRQSGGSFGDGPGGSVSTRRAGQCASPLEVVATITATNGAATAWPTAPIPTSSSLSPRKTPTSLPCCAAPQPVERHQQQQQQLLLQPYYQLQQQQQQMLLMYQQQQQQQQRLAECTAEEDVAGAAAAGGAASAAIMARSYTGFTPPASRGGCVGGTGGRASPIRCRTPRLSASPASAPLPAGTHLWDAAGGFVLGSFGDPAGAISTLSPLGGAGGSGGGSGGGGSPLHPSSRTMTPRSDATAALPGGAAPLTAAATAAAQLWWPLAAAPSLESLTPMTTRLSLFARPGHPSAAAGPTAVVGVRAR